MNNIEFCLFTFYNSSPSSRIYFYFYWIGRYLLLLDMIKICGPKTTMSMVHGPCVFSDLLFSSCDHYSNTYLEGVIYKFF